MSTEYFRVSSDIRLTIDYISPLGVPQTGKSNWTIKVSKNGVGNQPTTGVTITEIDAVNNAGSYEVTISGTTGFSQDVGTFELTIFDTDFPDRRWSETLYVTTTGDSTDSNGIAYFASSNGDGRIVDDLGDPIVGAVILVRNASTNAVITETSTDANGDWAVNINASANVFIQKSGYRESQTTLTVSGDIAIGPGSNVVLTPVSSVLGSGLTLSALLSYARRVARMRSGALTDAILKECVNDGLAYLSKRAEWGWYNRDGEMRLQAQVTDGTISVNGGSTTVTLAGATWPSWTTSGEIYIGSLYHKIVSVDSPTQITLATAYEGANLTGAAYRLFQDTYDLSPSLYQLNEIIYGQSWRWGPDAAAFGDVMRAKALYVDAEHHADLWATANGKLVLWPPPSVTTVVHYEYRAKPDKLVEDSDVADWDPNHEDLLHRAIDYQVALRYGDDAAGKSMREALSAMVEDLAYTTANETRPKNRNSPFFSSKKDLRNNRTYPNA
jgi:hypothetical protein